MAIILRRLLQIHFGKAAHTYDELAHFQRDVRLQAHTLARQYFPESVRVLDMGCGTGVWYHEWKDSESWQWFGSDVAFGMCHMAQQRHRCVVNADAQALPFAEASFGAVFSSLMMQWVSDQDAVYAELSRVCRPGSVLVLSTLVDGTLCELAKASQVASIEAPMLHFLSSQQYQEPAVRQGFGVAHSEVREYRYHYSNVRSLLDSIRDVGAGMSAPEARSRLTRGKWQALQSAYEQHRTQEGLPLSWKVLYLVLSKE